MKPLICEFCGNLKSNEGLKVVLLRAVREAHAVFVEESLIVLQSGKTVALSDCDSCNLRKIQFILNK